MPFAALEVDFHANPKVVAAGLDGAGLYARALSYCAAYLTDGRVPKTWAREVAGSRRALPQKLVAVGLWSEEGDYYVIRDWLVYNPPREYVLAQRDELSKKRAEAGLLGARARWQQHGKPDGKPHGKSGGKRDGKPDGNGLATGMATGMANECLPIPKPKSKTKPSAFGEGTERKDEPDRAGTGLEIPTDVVKEMP